MSQQPAAMNTIALSENGAAALADAVRIAARVVSDDRQRFQISARTHRAAARTAAERGQSRLATRETEAAKNEEYRTNRATNFLARLDDLAPVLHDLGAAGDQCAPMDD
jgi:hypothetical protein